jgi:hypothetical protein
MAKLEMKDGKLHWDVKAQVNSTSWLPDHATLSRVGDVDLSGPIPTCTGALPATGNVR